MRQFILTILFSPPPHHGLDASPIVGLTLVIILLVAGIYCYMWVLEESKVFFHPWKQCNGIPKASKLDLLVSSSMTYQN